MNCLRIQTAVDIQFKMELLGILRAEPGYSSAEVHRHPFFEIFYIEKGAFEVQIGQRIETVSEGDVFVISPDYLHSFTCDAGATLLYAGLFFSSAAGGAYPPCFRVKDKSLAERLEKVCIEADGQGADFLAQSAGALMSPLGEMLLSFFPGSSRGTEDVLSAKIKNYLHRHMCENITVKDIAAALYMNHHYLGEYFKKHNGVTVKEYLLELRMQKAFKLLKEDKLTVSQIAEALGFDTVQYFSTKFKAYYGMTTAKYRQTLKGNGK